MPEFKNLKVLINEKADLNEVKEVHKYPTIKDLLLHTAGFSYNSMGDPVGKEYDRIELFHSDTTTLETEVKKIAKVPLLFEPKKKWRYSVSMDVLGRIIEVIKNNGAQYLSPFAKVIKDISVNVPALYGMLSLLLALVLVVGAAR